MLFPVMITPVALTHVSLMSKASSLQERRLSTQTNEDIIMGFHEDSRTCSVGSVIIMKLVFFKGALFSFFIFILSFSVLKKKKKKHFMEKVKVRTNRSPSVPQETLLLRRLVCSLTLINSVIFVTSHRVKHLHNLRPVASLAHKN